MFSSHVLATLKVLIDRNKIKLASKLAAEYKDVQTLPPILAGQQAGPAGPKRPAAPATGGQGVKLIGGPEDFTYVPVSRLLSGADVQDGWAKEYRSWTGGTKIACQISTPRRIRGRRRTGFIASITGSDEEEGSERDQAGLSCSV